MATLYMQISPDAQGLASMNNPTILWVLIVVDGLKAACMVSPVAFSKPSSLT